MQIYLVSVFKPEAFKVTYTSETVTMEFLGDQTFLIQTEEGLREELEARLQADRNVSTIQRVEGESLRSLSRLHW